MFHSKNTSGFFLKGLLSTDQVYSLVLKCILAKTDIRFYKLSGSFVFCTLFNQLLTEGNILNVVHIIQTIKWQVLKETTAETRTISIL